jgi:hypothetical protein
VASMEPLPNRVGGAGAVGWGGGAGAGHLFGPGIHLEVAARRPGANLNALLDENLRDPLSGNAVLSGVPVRLEPGTS